MNLKNIRIQCDNKNCQRIFMARRSELKYYKKHFCSRKCMGAAMEKKLQPILVFCETCGMPKFVEHYNYRYNLSKTFFCNNTCRGKWMKKHNEEKINLKTLKLKNNMEIKVEKRYAEIFKDSIDNSEQKEKHSYYKIKGIY